MACKPIRKTPYIRQAKIKAELNNHFTATSEVINNYKLIFNGFSLQYLPHKIIAQRVCLDNEFPAEYYRAIRITYSYDKVTYVEIVSECNKESVINKLAFKALCDITGIIFSGTYVKFYGSIYSIVWFVWLFLCPIYDAISFL